MRWALRDYQHTALQSWLAEDGDGIIEAPCGAGKTLIGCAALCAVQTPALIPVHTRDLARQWQCRPSEACEGIEVGEICAGKDERDADVCIATLQSLARWEWSDLVQYGRTRGLVIVDEAHHIPAETFSRVLLGMAGRYRLGLTATPERSDGLTPLLHWTLGRTVHQIDRSVLQASGLCAGASYPSAAHWFCSSRRRASPEAQRAGRGHKAQCAHLRACQAPRGGWAQGAAAV